MTATTPDDTFDLRAAAADYVAGDLNAHETAAFEVLLAKDPALAREVAYWRRLGGALAPTTPDPAWAPKGDFARSFLFRQPGETSRPRAVIIPMPLWLGAATAACLGLAVGWWGSGHNPTVIPPPPIAFQEDGGPIARPADQQVAVYMPLTAINQVETTQPNPAVVTAEKIMKPWLGVWTKPVDLATHGAKGGQGLLVLRIASDSPSWNAGIRPGDVILNINQCPVSTPACIARRLLSAKPGDTVEVRYWQAESAIVVTKQVVLGVVYE
jgi:hypothetical protein